MKMGLWGVRGGSGGPEGKVWGPPGPSTSPSEARPRASAESPGLGGVVPEPKGSGGAPLPGSWSDPPGFWEPLGTSRSIDFPNGFRCWSSARFRWSGPAALDIGKPYSRAATRAPSGIDFLKDFGAGAVPNEMKLNYMKLHEIK